MTSSGLQTEEKTTFIQLTLEISLNHFQQISINYMFHTWVAKVDDG